MTKVHDLYEAHDRYWNDNLTLREVAEEYGMDYSALHKRFKQAGLPTRPRGARRPRVNGEYLAALRRLGEATVRSLADEVGVTPQRALYHLNRLVTLGEAVHVGGIGGQRDPRRYAARRGNGMPPNRR